MYLDKGGGKKTKSNMPKSMWCPATPMTRINIPKSAECTKGLNARHQESGKFLIDLCKTDLKYLKRAMDATCLVAIVLSSFALTTKCIKRQLEVSSSELVSPIDI